jgi:glycosyltransferase involved in cell wall biosynthesis
MAANDVAIYTPPAAVLYERRQEVTGGAERQMTLLARQLVAAGLDVAHIVLPVADPDPSIPDSLTLVERELVTTKRGPFVRASQMRKLWSALAEADADVYVFRLGLPALGVAALFCAIHRRRLVFSSSIDLDFTFGFYSGRRLELEIYKFGVRRADAVVVQSGSQGELARRAFPGLRRLVEIPSFATPAPAASLTPEAFLWVGRLDRYKQPLRYLELAEAVPEAQFRMIARRLDPQRSGGAPGGEGPDPGLEREALARAAELPNVELVEQRPHAEAMALVDRAVAIVSTGVAEGMPNLFLEAWARGVPVLSFEFDPDGRIAERGLGVAADGSTQRFHDAARRMWAERNDRAKLADRVRGYVDATHGLEAVTGRWMALIDDLRAA